MIGPPPVYQSKVDRVSWTKRTTTCAELKVSFGTFLAHPSLQSEPQQAKEASRRLLLLIRPWLMVKGSISMLLDLGVGY